MKAKGGRSPGKGERAGCGNGLSYGRTCQAETKDAGRRRTPATAFLAEDQRYGQANYQNERVKGDGA